MAFDLRGNHLKSVRPPSTLPSGFVDLAIDGAGRFYVAHALVHDLVRRDADRYGVVLSVFEPDGAHAGDLIRVTERDLRPPRFVLPHYTEVRVSALAGRLAVFYPASGVVDVYRDSQLMASVQVCMPVSRPRFMYHAL